ncbi:MAG: molybdopterin-dependent oxidoreductase [Deltaproteobacteria bacterium]|nr:molybdopterin-dependent oxidoreductase [Deltaproteobacteria bacterium]
MESKKKSLTELIALNRRNFIKLVVGGAAGIHLTPLPWKLMDDIAIWTQNWPWVPVPPAGEFDHVSSVCLLCPGGCGIKVRKVGERAVKIEGREDYPVNPGGICPLGAGGLQLLYNENIRFTGPKRRVGPRGSGSFKDISWEEALQELSERIRKLRESGRPESVVAVDGNPAGSTMALLIQRFLRTLGSPNYAGLPSAEDTCASVNYLMQGMEGPMVYDLENADLILSFGCGLIEGWGAPGRVLHAWGKWHDGRPEEVRTKVVQIDCRASNTASKSDQWLAVNPGTEAALALGLAHVIVREGLYDRSFVDNHAFGFNDWTSANGGGAHRGFKSVVLEKYQPETVADITGLHSDVIISLARAFAASKAPIALSGKGKGESPGSLYEFMAVQSLNALVGNINKRGGVLIPDPLPLAAWPEPAPDGIAERGLKSVRLDQAGSARYPFSRSLINNLTDAVLREGPSPVEALLVFSSNPAYTLPDGGRFRDAMKKIPFIVSFSPFKDESALMADLILPDHTYLEKTDDVVWPRGLQYPLYGLTRPVVDPVYDTAHSGDVLIALSKRIGKETASAFPWKDYEAALKERVKGLFDSGEGLTRYKGSGPVWEKPVGPEGVRPDYTSFDDMWGKIRSGGLWHRPARRFAGWDGLFQTPTGRFEFWSSRIELAVRELAREGSEKTALKALGVTVEGDEAYMAHYEPPPARAENQEYPLLLMPYGLINLSSGWIPNPHFLNKTLWDNQLKKGESFVEIHPETAFKHNLRQGDRILVESPRGKLRVRVNIFEGAMPGVVFMPQGLGHWAYDEYLRDKGANPNEIVDPVRDPLSGQPVWWNTRVRISKA